MENKMQGILENLPPELGNWVQMEAWDRGHSGGEEEVLNITKSLAKGLTEAFNQYKERIKRDGE